MNHNVNPEFVIILGDLIEGENKLKDRKSIEYIVNLLTKLKCPVHYIAGNHDLINISEEELMKLFHQKSLYYSFESNDFHFIALFSKDIED
jgi:3',5'-cyclic-AMP phosphodiesterase